MQSGDYLDWIAWGALIPAALAPFWRKQSVRDGLFVALLLLAALGPLARLVLNWGQAWSTALSGALWMSLEVSLLLFVALAALTRQAWRLAPLLLPYLLILGFFALVWRAAPGAALAASVPRNWLDAHILASVGTVGFLTIASVAALAGALQEKALKEKSPTKLSRQLPPVADSEGLAFNLLAASEIVLGLGLVTGMATQYLETGVLLKFDHKALLSVLTFFTIGGLLLAIKLAGLRGRMAARFVLLAYLLLLLAYVGVKFVKDVLLV